MIGSGRRRQPPPGPPVIPAELAGELLAAAWACVITDELLERISGDGQMTADPPAR